jgi:hypothetical protein
MKEYSVKFTAWEVVQPDGGGIGDEHLAYFSSSSEANKFNAQFKDHWPRRVRKIEIDKRWVVYDTVEEINQMEQLNKKAAALAKLTEEERMLLGLEPTPKQPPDYCALSPTKEHSDEWYVHDKCKHCGE